MFSFRERFQGLLYLMRPFPSMIATMYMLLGVYLVSDWHKMWNALTLRAAIAGFLAASFSFAINDYCDFEVDSLSKPERPLPSGRVSVSEAIILVIVLLVSSIGFTLSLPQSTWWVVFVALLLSAAYSLYLKNTLLLGTIAVALADSCAILLGGLIGGRASVKIWIGCILVFLFVMAQEVLFAVEDYEGDREALLQTTANRLGKNNALLLFKVTAILFVSAAFFPVVVHIGSRYYMVAAIICTVAPMLLAVTVLTWRVTERTIWFAGRLLVVLWVTSALPIVLLK